MKSNKKPSKSMTISGIILLILGLIGILFAWEGRMMRKGVALLYKDTNIAHLYKYYPILLIVSLMLIIGGIALLFEFIKSIKANKVVPYTEFTPQAESAVTEYIIQPEETAVPEYIIQPEEAAASEHIVQPEEAAASEHIIQPDEIAASDESDKIICSNCNQAIDRKSRFCIYCGSQTGI